MRGMNLIIIHERIFTGLIPRKKLIGRTTIQDFFCHFPEFRIDTVTDNITFRIKTYETVEYLSHTFNIFSIGFQCPFSQIKDDIFTFILQVRIPFDHLVDDLQRWCNTRTIDCHCLHGPFGIDPFDKRIDIL